MKTKRAGKKDNREPENKTTKKTTKTSIPPEK